MSPISSARAVQFLRARAAAMVVVSRPPWGKEVGAPTAEGRARCVLARLNSIGAPRALLVAVITARAIADPPQVAGRSA